jgi:G3E family GTPase
LAPRISFILISGFLGAGKTTLLRRIARDPEWRARRLAFIVNDFGDVDVDGQIVSLESNEHMTIARLSSGCICCTSKGEFEQTLHTLIETAQPEAIIVETSGVTNPGTVLQGLKNPRLRLDSIICMVDAERFTEYARLSAAVEWQVYLADFVLLNKADLVEPEQLREVEARVRQFNQKCAIIPCVYADAPLDVLFGAQGAHSSQELNTLAHEYHDHDHLERDGIDSVIVHIDGALSEERLTEFFKSGAMKDVYRAKGFVRIHGRDRIALLNFVPRRYSLEEGLARENTDTFVVFIGKNIAARHDEIECGLTQSVPSVQSVQSVQSAPEIR